MLTPGKNRIGTTIRFKATFRDEDDVLSDPVTLRIKTYSPSGRTSTYTYGTDTEAGRTSLGIFYLDFAPTEGGRWHIRWEADMGTSTVALEDDMIVQDSPFISSVSGAYA